MEVLKFILASFFSHIFVARKDKYMKKYLFLLPFLLLGTLLSEQAPLTMGIYNKKASKGKTVCVDIYGRDFQQILSMQYSLKWNPKHLKFKEIKGITLPGLSAQNFGSNKAKDGVLSLAWYDPQLRGITLPDGQTLYQVCFEVLGDAGTKSYLKFTDVPTPIEVSMGQGVLIGFNSEGGKFEVK